MSAAAAATVGSGYCRVAGRGCDRATEHVLDPHTLGDHLDRLFRAAWALCDSRDEAEDLVQETYARVLARPRLVRGQDDVFYLLRALRNTFISKRRAAACRPRSSSVELESLELADQRGGSADPAQTVETRELYAAIATLPDDFRDVLIAIDVVGLSYQEAATALGLREGTITSRLHRARRRFADLLDPV
jgi:RNA polymerase sigma-70 factor (ECF subfamily)